MKRNLEMSAIQVLKSNDTIESSEKLQGETKGHTNPRSISEQYSASEDDDEIQAIVRDPKTAKDTFNKKPNVLYNYDCHPT